MEGYRLGPVLTDKVISVVKRVEDMPYRYGNASIPVRFEEDGGGGGGGSEVRLGRVESSWLKGEQTDVVLLDETGNAVTPRQTFEATNYFVDISVDCGNKKVACAKVGNTWVLISAEC